MLILTRRIDEAIMIGSDIVVTVLNIQGRYAKIGITAPKTVSVHREEIFKRIQAEQQPEEGVSAIEEEQE